MVRSNGSVEIEPLNAGAGIDRFMVRVDLEFMRPGNFSLGRALFHYCPAGGGCFEANVTVYDLHRLRNYVLINPPRLS